MVGANRTDIGRIATEMIIKMQPKEFDRKPLISEKDPHKGDSDVYMGRVIIEFWCNEEEECERPAFAFSVDDPDKPSEEWIKSFLNGLKFATKYIEDMYGARQKGITPPV